MAKALDLTGQRFGKLVVVERTENNKTNNVIIEYLGRKQTMKQWCEELGLNYGMVKQRRRNGWVVPRLFEPKNE